MRYGRCRRIHGDFDQQNGESERSACAARRVATALPVCAGLTRAGITSARFRSAGRSGARIGTCSGTHLRA